MKSFQIDPQDLIAPIQDDGTLSERAREARYARIVAVQIADSLQRANGLGRKAADDYFVRGFNAGSLEVPDWIKEALGTLSVRSLARWRTAAREDADRLAFDPASARKGTGLLDTANGGLLRHFMLGLIAKAPLSAEDVLTQCRAEFGEELADRNGELKPMPPLRTFQRYIARLKAEEEVALTRMTDPDRYRSHFALTGTNAYAWVTEANQLWQIDASPIDVLCVDGRHSLYMCLDLATRRIVITTSKTPRASAVGLMTRKAVLKWGAPRGIKTDNGSDFVAKATVWLFRALDAEITVSPPYTPEDKGHVERAIKTFQRQVGRKLPGFIGHNVADRKEIESRRSFAERLGCDDKDAFAVRLTAEELQTYIDEWIEVDYLQRPHGGLGGRTPQQVADASTAPIRRVNEDALDVLLMKPVPCVMTKKGFKTKGNYFHSPEILPRTRALLRMDPFDAGIAHVFSAEGDEYLGKAVCYQLAGLDPVEALKRDRALREKKIAATTKPARDAVRHLSGTEIIDRHLKIKRADKAAREAERSNVIRLPRREEAHTTPQIEAAAEAARPAPIVPLDERTLHRQLQEGADLAVLRARPVVRDEVEESYERFRRALRLEEAQASGARLDEEDARWLAGYREGPEYSALSSMRETFGEAMGF